MKRLGLFPILIVVILFGMLVSTASANMDLPKYGWRVTAYLGKGAVPGISGAFHRFELGGAGGYVVNAYCVDPALENPHCFI